MYFDREGNEIPFLQWCMMFENSDYRVVKQDILPDGKTISTVWLGLDHSMWPGGAILIFETMIFNEDHEEIDIERYTTEAQAIEGHEQMIQKHLNKAHSN